MTPPKTMAIGQQQQQQTNGSQQVAAGSKNGVQAIGKPRSRRAKQQQQLNQDALTADRTQSQQARQVNSSLSNKSVVNNTTADQPVSSPSHGDESTPPVISMVNKKKSPNFHNNNSAKGGHINTNNTNNNNINSNNSPAPSERTTMKRRESQSVEDNLNQKASSKLIQTNNNNHNDNSSSSSSPPRAMQRNTNNNNNNKNNVTNTNNINNHGTSISTPASSKEHQQLESAPAKIINNNEDDISIANDDNNKIVMKHRQLMATDEPDDIDAGIELDGSSNSGSSVKDSGAEDQILNMKSNSVSPVMASQTNSTTTVSPSCQTPPNPITADSLSTTTINQIEIINVENNVNELEQKQQENAKTQTMENKQEVDQNEMIMIASVPSNVNCLTTINDDTMKKHKNFSDSITTTTTKAEIDSEKNPKEKENQQQQTAISKQTTSPVAATISTLVASQSPIELVAKLESGAASSLLKSPVILSNQPSATIANKKTTTMTREQLAKERQVIEADEQLIQEKLEQKLNASKKSTNNSLMNNSNLEQQQDNMSTSIELSSSSLVAAEAEKNRTSNESSSSGSLSTRVALRGNGKLVKSTASSNNRTSTTPIPSSSSSCSTPSNNTALVTNGAALNRVSNSKFTSSGQLADNSAAGTLANSGKSLCKNCGQHVYQMERMMAEKSIYHKKCFRCKECKIQLLVNNYASHEGQLYCKAHHRKILQPQVKLADPDEIANGGVAKSSKYQNDDQDNYFKVIAHLF